jgi:UDP-N-acetylglucosamine transferase subunit ALG13
VPLIHKFLSAGFKVIIAAGGDQKILLQSVFPELEYVEIKGYNVKYGSTKQKTLIKIIFQIPKILIAINRENKWLKRFIRHRNLDIIVADNRFGLHHKSILSVFITHQLQIKTSLGPLADRIAQKINYHCINQFDYCWVPDAAGEVNLAGALSHPPLMPATPVVYTGILSGITKQDLPLTHKLLLLLSGPEPQRTLLENILLQQLRHYAYPFILVRGLPAQVEPITVPAWATVYNYRSGQQLQEVINAAEIIISRSGYSTLMDILPLGKKCIVIPTPGQAEQEYLAVWLARQGYLCKASQQDFSLPHLLEEVQLLQVPDLSHLSKEANAGAAISAMLTLLDAKQ